MYESSEGSGINRVEVWFNGGKVEEFSEQPVYSWNFISDKWQQYDIEIKAYDNAGNMGNAYVSVSCSKSRIYNTNIFFFFKSIFNQYSFFMDLMQNF